MCVPPRFSMQSHTRNPPKICGLTNFQDISHQSMLPFIPILLLCQKICKTISRFPPISQDLKNWSQVKPEELQGYVQSLRSCTDYGRVGLLKSSLAHATGSQ